MRKPALQALWDWHYLSVLLFELIPSIMKILTPHTEYDELLDKDRRLNINAKKLIYQQVSIYYNKTVDEICDYNPEAVKKMFQALPTWQSAE